MRPATVLLLVLVASSTIGCSQGDPSPLTDPSVAGVGSTQSSCSIPPPPPDLAATPIASGVRLTWSPSMGAADYVVLVGKTRAAANVVLDNTTQLHYELSGMVAGTHYARVHGHNWCGTSEPSDDVEFRVSE